MSFAFNWDAFAHEEAFQTRIRAMLTNALNKNRPRILEDTIEVSHLDWGTEAPSLEMLEIGDMASDRFRGVFKLNYTGGATITVATKVQANLLNVYEQSAPAPFVMPKFVGAPASFPIPLHLTLRNIRLQGTVIVVFSKSKGLTLVFRNDPLQSIEVSSTFDIFPTIAGFLQQQIENQIRGLFREEVPAVLYELSLKYLPNSGIQHVYSREKSDCEPVAFAEIDTEKPVSLVNVLHVEAMLSSRRTLSLQTPVMPAAIVRSELHRRSLASKLQTPSLSLFSGGQALYDQLYFYSRHANAKAALQNPPKRRVVRLRKPPAESPAPGPAAPPQDAKPSAKIILSSTTPSASASSGVSSMASARSHAYSDASHAYSRGNHAYSEGSHAYSDDSRHAYTPGDAAYSHGQFAHRIPIAPLVRDRKGVVPLLHIPQRLVFPPALHSDLWPLPVQDIDELPPAYDA